MPRNAPAAPFCDAPVFHPHREEFFPSITAHFSRSEPSLFISHDACRDEGRRVFILFIFFLILFFLFAATAAVEVPLVELFACRDHPIAMERYWRRDVL
jgi:hypothetical protein